MDMSSYQRNPHSSEYAIAKRPVMKVLFSTLLLLLLVVVVVITVVDVVVVPTCSASHSDHHPCSQQAHNPVSLTRRHFRGYMPVVSGSGGELSGEGFECRIFFFLGGMYRLADPCFMVFRPIFRRGKEDVRMIRSAAS